MLCNSSSTTTILFVTIVSDNYELLLSAMKSKQLGVRVFMCTCVCMYI